MGKRLEPVWDEGLHENIAWRIENLNDLLKFAIPPEKADIEFDRRAYSAPSDSWDHDHCEGCWAKFMNGGVHRTLAIGWLRVGSPAIIARDQWLCDDCHRILGSVLNGSITLNWSTR